MQDPATQRWFLPDVRWKGGNHVVPLVHGATYFRRLHDELQQLRAGDRVYFTDWRGDPDQRLLPDGRTVGGLLCELCERDVEVRGLVWRSHSDILQFSATPGTRAPPRARPRPAPAAPVGRAAVPDRLRPRRATSVTAPVGPVLVAGGG